VIEEKESREARGVEGSAGDCRYGAKSPVGRSDFRNEFSTRREVPPQTSRKMAAANALVSGLGKPGEGSKYRTKG
jgi:hypothetical protein